MLFTSNYSKAREKLKISFPADFILSKYFPHYNKEKQR